MTILTYWSRLQGGLGASHQAGIASSVARTIAMLITNAYVRFFIFSIPFRACQRTLRSDGFALFIPVTGSRQAKPIPFAWSPSLLQQTRSASHQMSVRTGVFVEP